MSDLRGLMGGDKAAAAAAVASAIDEGEENGGTKDAPLGVKLRRVVSVCKRGGLCTPPPSWNLEEPGPPDLDKAEPRRRFVSARKLCAGLWKIQDLPSMSDQPTRLQGPSAASRWEGAHGPPRSIDVTRT